jgi:CCR4-NOT transcription complex subunit 4
MQFPCFCSQRRLAQQKKQRERERKDLDALGRRHLANVRVVQRNVVYVVGIGPRFAKEEVCISTFAFNTNLNLNLILTP